MGSRGPTPQPKAIAQQKGVYRKDRYGDEVAESEALEFIYNEIPQAPEDFPPLAVQLWNKQLGQAQKVYGYISWIDMVSFEEYCLTYAMMRSLRARIANPPQDFDARLEWGNFHKLSTRFDKLSAQFGFDPSSRTSVKLVQKVKEQVDKYTL